MSKLKNIGIAIIAILIFLFFTIQVATGIYKGSKNNSHIANVGVEFSFPEQDAADLRLIFDKYNSLYFNNELSVDHIFYADLGSDITGKKILGQFVTMRDGSNNIITAIRISDYYIADKDDLFRGVLVHEMCHIYEWQNTKSLDHNKSFDKKIYEISNRYNIAIPLR